MKWLSVNNGQQSPKLSPSRTWHLRKKKNFSKSKPKKIQVTLPKTTDWLAMGWKQPRNNLKTFTTASRIRIILLVLPIKTTWPMDGTISATLNGFLNTSQDTSLMSWLFPKNLKEIILRSFTTHWPQLTTTWMDKSNSLKRSSLTIQSSTRIKEISWRWLTIWREEEEPTNFGDKPKPTCELFDWLNGMIYEICILS